MSFRPSLTLVRGLPGSGKTTRAEALVPERPRPLLPEEREHFSRYFSLTVFRSWDRVRPRLFSADDFFMVGGEYKFNPALLPQAHAACISGALATLDDHSVIVHNTFSQRWEMEPYLVGAAARNTPVTVIDLFDAGLSDAELAARNGHGVPEATIADMRGRWEFNWWAADPRAPWERGA